MTDQLENTAAIADTALPEETSKAPEAMGKLTIDYILERLEEISRDTTAKDAIAEIHQIPGDGSVEGERAMALANIAEQHEKTNRELIRTYQSMYEDLKYAANRHEPVDFAKTQRLNWVWNNLQDDELPEDLRNKLLEKLEELFAAW